MTYDEMVEYLRRDGNLRVPCSRYGWDTWSCTDWAIACALVHADNGSEITPELLDEMMGLVVNDSDVPARRLRAHGHFLATHPDLAYILGELTELELAEETC